jgi:catechol 2,3-dioxygenase-like lactoylglutathione lyase family enzyme
MREFGIRTVDGHRMRFGARRGLGAPAPSGGAVNLHSGMERAVPILPADDLAVAKKFYIEALGFEAAFEWTDDGRTGLLGVRRGTMTLTLDCPMSGHGRNACVSLHVHSADEYYEESGEARAGEVTNRRKAVYRVRGVIARRKHAQTSRCHRSARRAARCPGRLAGPGSA